MIDVLGPEKRRRRTTQEKSIVRWVIARHGNICGSGPVMG